MARLVGMAGVAYGEISATSVWQAWRLVTLTLFLGGRRRSSGFGVALGRHGCRALLRGRRGIW